MIIHGRLLLDAHEPPAPGWIRVERDRIAEVGEGPPPGSADVGDDRAVICPGFIDAHLHVPQFDSVGVDGLELLDWLEQVIYPAEAAWSDARLAARQVDGVLRRLLECGTLGFAGYLTSHPHAVPVLVQQHGALPLRCAVGRVLMDRNAPDALCRPDAPDVSGSTPRCEVTVNPRFAPACSERLLAQAGRAAATAGAIVQTHLAESRPECALVSTLFPDDETYTDVYDRFGLLTSRTLLAHCLHLDDSEWTLIRERESVVVHCPAANLFLRTGLFDLDAARAHGVRLAIGSDVAAGPDSAMPRVARAVIETAKARSLLTDRAVYVPDPAEAWQMITRGNADALGWHDAGRLEVGATADLLVLRPPFEIDEHLVGRLIYSWRDDFIADRIVNGRLVPRSGDRRSSGN